MIDGAAQAAAFRDLPRVPRLTPESTMDELTTWLVNQTSAAKHEAEAFLTKLKAELGGGAAADVEAVAKDASDLVEAMVRPIVEALGERVAALEAKAPPDIEALVAAALDKRLAARPAQAPRAAAPAAKPAA